MKRPLGAGDRIEIAIGQRPRVVVGGEQNPLLPLRMPLDDDVRHRHRRAAQRILGAELLQAHLAAELLEMLDEHLLLLLHAGRAARPRTDAHKLFEIAIRPLRIERILRRAPLPLAAQPGPTARRPSTTSAQPPAVPARSRSVVCRVIAPF